MLTRHQVENAIKKANELGVDEDLILKRMNEVVDIIQKETKSKDSWWDWEYTEDPDINVPTPWNDLMGTISIHIDSPSALLTECDLYNFPGDWLWTRDVEIKRQIQEIIKTHKKERAKVAQQQKEYREKRKKLDAALKKEEKKLKVKLGIK